MKSKKQTLPPHLIWLADSPLYIDHDQLDRFYDAVVRPESREGVTSIELTEETLTALKGKLNLEAEISPSSLTKVIKPFFSFFDIKVTGGGEGEASREKASSESFSIEMHPITTPQRQLEQLTFHYLAYHPDKIHFPYALDESEWRDPDEIIAPPRSLAFLDLPGQREAEQYGLPYTKLIPTAAEFEKGNIELLYNNLRSRDGDSKPPRYPEAHPGISASELKRERKTYWDWFDKEFSATKSMIVVEKAASMYGRIRWIDFRLPITNEGDTLHLHIAPSLHYDTGVLAYNFIKRGFKHGIRLVGHITL